VLSLIVNYIYNLYKANKSNLPDEALNSREFWMFLGSMFIILSLIQVISATSIPVFNKLFGSKTAVPQAKDYNNIQLWMAMPIMILMAVGQYFTYRASKYQSVLKDLFIYIIYCSRFIGK
jgi:cytochrome c-type biogenesis protein CcmF